MSKSIGNVIDPNDVLDRYSADSFRCSPALQFFSSFYLISFTFFHTFFLTFSLTLSLTAASYYLMRESSLGSDLPCSEKSLIAMHNSDLADTLVRIVVILCVSCSGQYPTLATIFQDHTLT